MHPTSTNVLYTCNQHLWNTTNAASSIPTWNDMGSIYAYSNGDGVTAMSISADGTMLYFGDSLGSYYKVNIASGKSPSKVTKPCGSGSCVCGGIHVDPTSASTVWVAVSTFGDPHLLKSTNSGTTWTHLGGGIPGINYF